MGSNAVADAVAARYGVDKSDMLGRCEKLAKRRLFAVAVFFVLLQLCI